MINYGELVINALKGHIRVNKTLKTVEIYDDFGVKTVLRDLSDSTIEAFEHYYPTY